MDMWTFTVHSFQLFCVKICIIKCRGKAKRKREVQGQCDHSHQELLLYCLLVTFSVLSHPRSVTRAQLADNSAGLSFTIPGCPRWGKQEEVARNTDSVWFMATKFPAPKWAGHKTVTIPSVGVGALLPSAVLHLWLLRSSFFWFISSSWRNTCSRSFLGYGVWEIKLF